MTESTHPVLTVIVLNWNGAGFLPRCFQSLREQTLRNFQVLLVDNNSTDDSIVLTKRDFPEVDVLDLGENLGYAEANNRAAAQSHATYLLFLNNDTYLDSTALELLVVTADKQPDTAILAPTQRSYNGTLTLSCGMGVDILGFPAFGNPHAGNVFYADGAALFIRRSVFKELEGFDPHYFIFFEEQDLCWRAWLRGYRVGIVPQSVVYHEAGGTVGSSLVKGTQYTTSKRKRRLTHRNQLATILKNYSTPVLCAILPLFITLTAVEILALIGTGQRAVVAESYAQGWLDLFRDRSYLITRRHGIQTSRVVSDWTILRKMQWKLAPVRQVLRGGMPVIK